MNFDVEPRYGRGDHDVLVEIGGDATLTLSYERYRWPRVGDANGLPRQRLAQEATDKRSHARPTVHLGKDGAYLACSVLERRLNTNPLMAQLAPN